MNRGTFKRLKAAGANLPRVNYPLNPIGYNMNDCGCGCGGSGGCDKSRYKGKGVYTDNFGAWNVHNQSQKRSITSVMNQNGTQPSLLEQFFGVQQGQPIGTIDISLETPTIFKLSVGVLAALVAAGLINKAIN